MLHLITLRHLKDINQILRDTDSRRLHNCIQSQRAERSYSMFKVRRGGGEEIPLVQGKEQWLRFAGAAMKRYPTPKVRETQVRLKPYSQKTSQSNHTRTTALSNSMKLSHAHGATQDGGSWWRDLTECDPLEKVMANHFSIHTLTTP